MAWEDPNVVVASGARAATGNSGALPANGVLDKGMKLNVLVDVTAVTGTGPSMTVSVEWSQDGGVTFAQGDPADTFTAMTATGTKVKQFDVKAPVYRLVWTITGTTPSFTFSAREYVTAS